MIAETFRQMSDAWKSEIVARGQIKAFTGGALSPGRMANLDSAGLGPERFYIGRKCVYPKQALIQWLAERSQVSQNKTEK